MSLSSSSRVRACGLRGAFPFTIQKIASVSDSDRKSADSGALQSTMTVKGHLQVTVISHADACSCLHGHAIPLPSTTPPPPLFPPRSPTLFHESCSLLDHPLSRPNHPWFHLCVSARPSPSLASASRISSTYTRLLSFLPWKSRPGQDVSCWFRLWSSHPWQRGNVYSR